VHDAALRVVVRSGTRAEQRGQRPAVDLIRSCDRSGVHSRYLVAVGDLAYLTEFGNGLRHGRMTPLRLTVE
jgi:hypothetical protein